MKPRRLSFPHASITAAFSVALFIHFAAQSASAVGGPYYWDNNGTTTGFGTPAAGTWAAPTTGSATQGWSTSATGALLPGTITTDNIDTLNFGTGTTGNGLGAGTITVTGTVAAGNLTYGSQSGNILLTGGTINLAATSIITVNVGTQTIASLITGASTSLTKAGANTLKITGANTGISGGDLNINAGEVNIATSATALGGATGFTVQLGNTIGTSSATLSMANSLTFPNPIIVRAGTTGGTKTIGISTGTITPAFSGVITANDNLTVLHDVAGTGAITVNNAGNMVVSGKTVTFSLLTAATLTDSSTWGGAGKLAYSGSGIGTINVTGAKTHSGGSTLGTMSGATGVVSVNASSTGPANAPTNGPFGIGALTIGATKVRSGTTADITVGNSITFSGAPTFPTVASEKSLTFTGDADLGAASRTLTVDVGFTVPGKAVNFQGIISSATPASGITKAGTGGLTLSGANSYSGATAVTGGTLTLSGSGSVNNSSAITVNGSGVKLLHTSSTAVTPAVTLTQGILTGNGTLGAVDVGAGTGGVISNNNGVAGASLTIGALTFNGAATVNTYHNSITAPIITTSLATTVSTTVTINPTAASWADGVTYDLISYAGSYGGGGIGQFALAPVPNLSARQSANLINTGTALAMAITGDTPYWTGTADNKWNTTTANNWKLLSNNDPALFIATDNALFNDNATGAGPISVDIDLANVATTSTTFNNSTKDYVLSSTGGFGISSGFLTKNGSGTLTINNANTYSGGTTVNAGILQLGNANAIGTGTLTLNGGNLDSLVANLVNAGNNAQAWNSNFTFIGTESLDLGTGAVTMSGDRTVTVSAKTLTVGGAIGGGAVGITKLGAGTLNFTGTNTFTGTIAVNAGTLALSPTGALTRANTVTGSAAINANPGTGNLTLSGNLSGFTGTINVAAPVASPGKLVTGITSPLGTGTIVNIASGTTWFTNNATQTGITVNLSGTGNGENAGALRTDTGTFDSTSSIVLQADSSIGGATSTNTGTINAVISQNGGPFSLTKAGSGSTVLGAANTYSGPTVISAGALQINAANNLGDGSVTNTITLGTATLQSTANTYDLGVNRAITLAGNGKVQADAGTLTVSGTVTNGANLFTLFGAGNINVSGVIGAGATPTGGLNIGSTTLPANVTLSGNNLFTGNVSLPAANTQPKAVLTLTDSGALGVGPKTVTSLGSNLTNGGEIHLQNNISLASDISFTVSGFTIYNDSGSNTINGTIAMASGSGATYLTSTSGTLTINGNMSANATTRQLRLRGAGNGVIAGIISNGSTVDLPVLKDSGTGTWTLTGVNTYTGATTISAGTLVIDEGSIATSSGIVNNAALEYKLTTNARTYANVISGTGSLTKSGTNSLTLSGVNTYSGNTTVSAGTLTLSNAASALNANTGNDASTVTIAATGATLDLTYTGTDKVDKLFIGATELAPGFVYGNASSVLPVIARAEITGPGTLTVGGGFSSWITGTFANGTVPSGQQGANQDFDNDGISNLVEYAIAGQDPTVGNPTISTFNGTTLSFTKRADASGLTYAIQDSTDLGLADAWAEVPAGPSYTNNPTTISFTLTPGTPAKNFFRLQVLAN